MINNKFRKKKQIIPIPLQHSATKVEVAYYYIVYEKGLQNENEKYFV